MTERHEIRLSGSGGQGIILAGYLVAQAAAIFEHKNAVLIQDYGPEARGGSCRADVVVSEDRVLYPYIDSPSVLIAMSQQAFDKYTPDNRQDATVIIDRDLVHIGKFKGSRLLSVPARGIAEEIGRPAVANVVMLGFFTAVTNIVSLEAMKQSLLASVLKNAEEINLAALERGYEYGQESLDPARAAEK
jgi:2-oxoglutarate ferredoxin oxidoreductase subunit gamma